MEKFREEIITEMSESVKLILSEEIGENMTSMSVNFCNEHLVIHISCALWPPEQQFHRRIEELKTFYDFKSRQFEEVKDILKSELEELSGCKILKIDSLLCKDHSRIIVVTFLKRVENELKIKKFAYE